MSRPPFPTILLFPQQQIDDPAAADMWPRPAAVRQDVGVVAARLCQRVSEDRQQVEAAVVVDRLREVADGAVVPGEPCRWVGNLGPKAVDEDIAEQITKKTIVVFGRPYGV